MRLNHRATLFQRLVIGMAIASLLAIAASAAFIYIRFGAQNSAFKEGTLHSFAHGMMREIRQARGNLTDIDAGPTAQLVVRRQGLFAVVSASGDILIGSPGLTAPLVPPDEATQRQFVLAGANCGAPIYGLSLPMEFDHDIYVQVAFPSGEIVYDSVLEEFIFDVGWVWLPFIICILLTNVVVAHISLRPLRIIVQQAEAIGPGSVTKRLTEQPMPCDVLVLVQAVNQALDRLQDGYATLEEFVADVAHELRTPLAVVKATLAVSDASVARDVIAEFAALERLIQQLLDLAKLGGLRYEQDDIVDLRDVAREAASFLAPLIVTRKRLIEVIAPQTPVRVVGARDFLVRATRNLIENALAHAPIHTLITVVVDDWPALSVIDRGPGFSPSKLDPIGRRAARLRSDRSEGIGLGLSIVERTMEGHGGELKLANDAGGGARAMMKFPCNS